MTSQHRPASHSRASAICPTVSLTRCSVVWPQIAGLALWRPAPTAPGAARHTGDWCRCSVPPAHPPRRTPCGIRIACAWVVIACLGPRRYRLPSCAALRCAQPQPTRRCRPAGAALVAQREVGARRHRAPISCVGCDARSGPRSPVCRPGGAASATCSPGPLSVPLAPPAPQLRRNHGRWARQTLRGEGRARAYNATYTDP